MTCSYRIREDKIKDEDGILHTVYGIDSWEGDELKASVPDVFFKQKNAEAFIDMCNTLSLSFVQLMDMIDIII